MNAQNCLDRLGARFGDTNERVMGLHGLCQEAAADGNAGLEEVLQRYNGVLNVTPENMVRMSYSSVICIPDKSSN